jgi:hypothetical protein
LTLSVTVLSLSAAVLCTPAATAAQAANRDSLQRAAPWRIGVFVGGAHSSPATRLAVTRGLNHRFVGFDAQTTMLRAGSLNVNYAFQLLPLVLIDGRPDLPPWYVEEPGTGPRPDRAYAFGISPFGLELSTPATARVALFGGAAAGGLLFSRPFPVPEAQRANFTLEYGGGALVRIGGAHWIRAGYKYHHLSNAYMAHLNPGVDGNVLYAGYQWGVYLPR